MATDFDLLGDPIPEGWGKRGRPPHMPTDEKRRLVMQLLAFDWADDKIAAALSITRPTLRKNYLRELKSRDAALARLEANLQLAMMKQVDAGNVGAIDKLWARVDKHNMVRLAHSAAHRGEDKAEKLGKKQQQQKQAGEITGKFAPPAPPRLVN